MSKINFDKTNNAHIGAAQSARTEKTETKASSGTQKNTPAAGDTVAFSARGAEVGQLVDQIKDLPDTRAERVETLKAQIESGEYSPSGEDIADAILKDEK